ncbi:MAG TPA: hypothetical protein VFM94_00075 [Solirubrobacterales bacterium]|nr:hypothetical protein [Solirubrobacterales bacterium]
MSRRWFVSRVTVGAANEAKKFDGGRPLLEPSVKVKGEVGGAKADFTATGPQLHLLGPGDVLGFERTQLIREEPAPGTLDAVAENLACVEFADASLPWLFSPPPAIPQQRPWIVLLVLREDEGELIEGDPLPVARVPAAALPAPGDVWAWAHAEARVEDAVGPKAAIEADVRSGSQTVISRLICPRRLEAGKGWLACVVPATRAGVEAGFGGEKAPADPYAVPWDGTESEVRLPVYHSWRFRTGDHGSFEELARLVEPISSRQLAKDTGFGSHAVDVSLPWRSEKREAEKDPPEPPPAEVTTVLQGALRIPGAVVPTEKWSDKAKQEAFAKKLTTLLDAPGARFENVGAEVDRDDKAVAPPLYGSHFTGQREVPPTGWPQQLNLEVRHRLAASVGARYVEREQEFLMARAWEQLGAVREANRLLAAAELANETAVLAQAKHLAPMGPADLTTAADPMRNRMEVGDGEMLAQRLASSAVPAGLASTSFRRLARRGGGLARRVGRVRTKAAASEMPIERQPPLVSSCMEATQRPLSDPIACVMAREAPPSGPFGGDPASLPRAAIVDTMAGQQTLIGLHDDDATKAFALLALGVKDAVGAAFAKSVPSPLTIRLSSLRPFGIETTTLPTQFEGRKLDPAALADSVREGMRPLAQQVERIGTKIEAPGLVADEAAQRPLRPIMEHPRFGMPIAAELLHLWPEWALPGINGFPSNRVTLVETNPAFVEALMVGLNQEFNRELLWRELPTDQRGSAFTRFWPSEVDNPDVDEIARWPLSGDLGSHDETGGKSLLVLLVRAEVLRRFPGTTVLAAKSKPSKLLPHEGEGEWKEPKFLLAVDDQTALFGFELDADKAVTDKWLFVLREPMRGTQFGFDTRELELKDWADLNWDRAPEHRGFVVPRIVESKPPIPENVADPDPAVIDPTRDKPDPGAWGVDAADIARIAFNRPFQLAVSAEAMLKAPA